MLNRPLQIFRIVNSSDERREQIQLVDLNYVVKNLKKPFHFISIYKVSPVLSW